MKKLVRNVAITMAFTTSFSACVESEGALPKEVLLSGNWEVQSSAQISESGEVLSTAQASTEGWYPATVPSTVMGVLTANGLYKDLLTGTNYNKADRTPFDVSWWYRTTFDLAPEDLQKHVRLTFDGITYRANVWLNGKQIAAKEEMYGAYCRFAYDITGKVEEKNALAIEVFRAQSGEPNVGFVDWNPRPLDENMGIFREVRLFVTGDVEMQNTWVRSEVNTETLDEAKLYIETALTNLSDKEVSGELTGKIEDIRFAIPVSLGAGERRVVTITPNEVERLHIKNPRLWWSSGLGIPELYDLDLRFVTENSVSAREKVTFGIRQIDTYLTPNGHKGFILNGKKVLIKSAGWTDDIFLRDTPESNEIQVSYVKDMNMNSIRFENIWGNCQNIYDLCDHYGLLALVGWSCQWEWEGYMDTPDDDFGCIVSEHDINLVARYFHDQVIWLRNHPSVFAWMVGSDKLPRPELEKKYLELFPTIDDRPYVGAAKTLVSEFSGPTGMKMNGPYEYVGPNYWYLDTEYGGAFGFNTETGPGSEIPVYESIRKMIPEGELWPLNEAWDFHCTTSTTALNTMQPTTEAIDNKYGKATDLKSYLDRAHLLNYESTKSMFEAFRINKAEGTGIVQWMLNSAWPSMYWQLYDYYMIPTPAYYGVKRGNNPHQLIYNYKDNGIYAVNETPAKGENLKAVIRGFSMDSKPLYTEEVSFSIDENESQQLFTVDNTAKNSFLQLELFDNQGNLLAENFYTLASSEDSYFWDKTNWVGTPMKGYSDFKALADLPASELDIKVGQEQAGSISVEITNPTETIAFFAQFLLKDDQGEVVYPVFWADNYITLLPGEKKTLVCTLDPNRINTPVSVLQVNGWNLKEQVIRIR